MSANERRFAGEHSTQRDRLQAVRAAAALAYELLMREAKKPSKPWRQQAPHPAQSPGDSGACQ